MTRHPVDIHSINDLLACRCLILHTCKNKNQYCASIRKTPLITSKIYMIYHRGVACLLSYIECISLYMHKREWKFRHRTFEVYSVTPRYFMPVSLSICNISPPRMFAPRPSFRISVSTWYHRSPQCHI